MEALTKKVELCKQEVYKAEGGATKQNAALEARCLELTRRVEHYERLERELDQAVIDSGNGDTAAGELMAEVGASLPTDGARRIRQSIGLAKQVSDLQKEVNSLSSQLDEANQEVLEARAEASKAARAHERALQPQSYLVEMIEAKEERANAAEKKVTIHAGLNIDSVSVSGQRGLPRAGTRPDSITSCTRGCQAFA